MATLIKHLIKFVFRPLLRNLPAKVQDLVGGTILLLTAGLFGVVDGVMWLEWAQAGQAGRRPDISIPLGLLPLVVLSLLFGVLLLRSFFHKGDLPKSAQVPDNGSGTQTKGVGQPAADIQRG
jgi:hypothetical protein